MLTERLERKFLNCLYKRYIRENGYGKRNLDKFKFYSVDQTFEDDIPEIAIINNGTKKYLISEWASELEVKGFVTANPSKLTFSLTELGYDTASRGWLGRLIGTFNNNPGLAIPISIVSLIVAVIAIFLDAK